MQANYVPCPHCGQPFELSRAIQESIERRLVDERAILVAAGEANARQRIDEVTKDLDIVRAKLGDAQKRDADLSRREREVDERHRDVVIELEQRLHQERARIQQTVEAAARQRFEAAARIEAQAREAETAQLRQALQDASDRESELLKRARELGERELRFSQQLELKLSEEAVRIRAEAETQAQDRYEAQARARHEAVTREMDAARAELAQSVAAHEAELQDARDRLAEAAKREADLVRQRRESEELAQQRRREFETREAELNNRSSEVEARAAHHYELRLTEERTRIRSESEAIARERYQTQARADAQVLEDTREELAMLRERDARSAHRTRELEEQARRSAAHVEEQLEHTRIAIRQEIEAAADARVASRVSAAVEAREAELRDARDRLADAAKREVDLLRQRRDLEAQTQQHELEIETREAELDRRSRELEAQVAHQYELKLAEESARIRSASEAAAQQRYEMQARLRSEADAQVIAEAHEELAQSREREASSSRRARELEEQARSTAEEREESLAQSRAAIRQELEADAATRVVMRVNAAIEASEADLRDARDRLGEASKREVELLRRQRALEDAAQQRDLEMEQRLSEAQASIWHKAEQSVREKLQAEAARTLEAKELELRASLSRVTDLQRREVELTDRARDLEGRQRQIADAFQQRLDAELARARHDADAYVQQQVGSEADRREALAAEHQVQIATFQRQVNELQNKLHAATAHARGEAQEVMLRDLLVESFSRDRIADVPVGTSGSDVVHRVLDDVGREAGVIIWESKRTKNWSDEWLPKLRDDQRSTGADVAILVTATLPQDVRVFGPKDGVWVTSWAACGPVATMLRRGVLDVAAARQVNVSRGEKMSMLYEYLTGHEFKNRFLGAIEAYQEMQDDLDSERRALTTIWKKRDRQLKRAIENLSSFYGAVQGIAGAQVVDIEPLSLSSGDDDLLDAIDAVTEMSPALQDLLPTLKETLYALIPTDGSTVGNKNLSNQFRDKARSEHQATIGDDEYRLCKDRLLTQGRIKRGMGKGGSVSRLTTK